MTSPAEAIVFYDGACGLCHRLVVFVLQRDARDRFRFASLQSGFAASVLAGKGWKSFPPLRLPSEQLDTVYLLVDDGQAPPTLLARSAAVFEILRRLGMPWSMLAAFGRALPRSLADWGYRSVARHRYRIFGRSDNCFLLSPAERTKFLDG